MNIIRYQFNKWLVVVLLVTLVGPGCATKNWAEYDEYYSNYRQFSEAFNRGDYKAATPFAKEALRLVELQFGQNHKSTDDSIQNLALAYYHQGLYTKAEPLFKRSLHFREQSLGRNHPNVAVTLNGLAMLYSDQGAYAKAEPLFKRSLVIRETTLGSEHLKVAESLTNLAGLYVDQGYNSKAEPLFKRSMAIIEESLGGEHPSLAPVLHDYATLLEEQGENINAEFYYEWSLDILENSFGLDHPKLAYPQNKLANLYSNRGAYKKADYLFKISLKIRENSLGKNHPLVANILHNMALMHSARAEYGKAAPIFKRSINIWENTLGKNHPYVVSSLHNLASVYAAQGLYHEAEFLFAKSIRKGNRFLDQVLWGAGKKTRQSYIHQQKLFTDVYLSLLTRHNTLENAQEAINISLMRKGLLLRIAAKIKAVSRSTKIPELRSVALGLSSRQAELARLQLSGSDQYEKIITLEEEVNMLEAKLGRRVQALSRSSADVDANQLVAALKPQQIIVDFQIYQQRNLENGDLGEYQLFAVVVDSEAKQKVRIVELGKLAPINKLIQEYRDLMENYDDEDNLQELHSLFKKLYSKLWQPLATQFNEKQTAYLIPDGVLHLLPFKMLMNERGNYLVQMLDLIQLSSARDLVIKPLGGDAKEPVIFASPDYSTKADGIKSALKEVNKRTTGLRMADLFFTPLVGAKKEGQMIAAMMEASTLSPKLFSQGLASEKALSEVDSPRILHLATHGFFLDTLEKNSEQDNRGLKVALSTIASDKIDKYPKMIQADPYSKGWPCNGRGQ
ncbi:MAG: tetratricopeptide repeat protein [Magnetococcales bacterium]|nr:tetratricopeptide repeat protein [Magnetococcales bacterium]